MLLLSGPYATYRFNLREAMRKMEPVDGLSMTDVIGIGVQPAQRDSLDISKIVVQRDGVIVPPIASTLAPRTFTNGFGAQTVKHAGLVAFPLKAFAPGATVVVTAIPESGENIVTTLPNETLERIR